MPAIIEKELRIRWVPVPVQAPESPPASMDLPVPDDAALRRIAETVRRASEQMDKAEAAGAERILREGERECRSYRFTEETRPFLAEIFLRQGILRLWEGRSSDAEALLSRVRALRPGFTPEPALFPPRFLSAWESVRGRPVPEAELLIESIPSGAEIFVDGERRGSTPSRVRTRKLAPVRIRISHPGYKDAETVGQWLPGDTETLRFSLPGDRMARLGEILAAEGRGMDAGAGPLVGELAAAAGTARVAVLMLERHGSGEEFRIRLYAGRPAGRNPVLLGEKTFSGGRSGVEMSGKWAAGALASDGWPRSERQARPWYTSVWFWVVVLSAGVAAALGASGGGGSGGAPGGTVAVNF